MKPNVVILILVMIGVSAQMARAQQNVNQCDNPGPTDSIYCSVASNYIDLYTLDLSGSPNDSGNITIIQPQADLPCCGDEVHMNARCSALELYLHPSAIGIRVRFIGNNASNGTFRIGDALCTDNGGATLSLNSIDNQDATICLDPTAAAPFLATICKPGGADYCIVISSIAAESFGDAIIISDDVINCATQVNVTTTAQLDNITWTSINGSLALLDCGPGPLDCLDPIFTPPGNLGSPTTFTYQVCGEYVDPFCGNLGVLVCDTVYVQVIPLVSVVVNNIINCNYNYPFTVNATVSPQFPTFEYGWYDAPGGPTGGGNLIATTLTPSYTFGSAGNYSLYVYDTDVSYACPFTVTQDFNITDLPEPPAIIIPPAVICNETDLTFVADQIMNSTAEYTVAYYWTFPNSNEGTAFGPGPHTITYPACGNKDAMLDVVIESTIDPSVICYYFDQVTIPTDITPPVITSHPADITVDCTNDPPWGPNDITATDNCSGITIDTSSSTTPGVCSGEYTITRVWTVTDNCGNSASEEQIVTVTDNIAPIVDPLTGANYDCVASIPAPDVNIVVAQDQGCGMVTVTFGGDVGSNVCGGSVTRTYNVTDDCGNVTPVTQVFTLNDNIPPSIICPGSATFECVAEVPALPSTYAEFMAAGGSASDNCGIVEGSFTSSESSAGICPTTITRTFTIEDSCGAIAQCQQIISIVPPPFIWINPPADITLDCGQADDFVPGVATYSNLQSGVCEITGTVPGVVTPSYNECGGTIIVHYEYTDVCGNTINHDQTITVTRAPLPVWTNAPGPITITCDAALSFVPVDIDFSNSDDGSCLIQGTITNPAVTPNFDNCGGTITVDWTYTDPCGYILNHQQIVTVDPAPPFSWINPPADFSVTCNNAEIFTAPNLDYSNAANGSCLIQGTVVPVIDPQYDECGGTITVTWADNDECGRPIPAHVQTVTVLPADIASWVSPPPATITLDCNSSVGYDPGAISYSNGNNGSCLIAGQVLPYNIDSNFTECGGSITIDWEFTDNCNRQITYQQIVTVLPAPPAAWVNPPPNITLSCNQADTLSPSDLEYTNAGSGNCLIQGFAPPTVTPNYTDCAGGTLTVDWEFTDNCNNQITHTQLITVVAAPIPQWVNPPADTTITCNAGLLYAASQLQYTNNGVGTCLITGFADPVVVNNFDNCGGTITIDWEFTDACLRQITHTQVITVLPAPVPVWQNPPGPITITCNQALTYTFPNLSYDNAASSSCLITGSVAPVVTPNFTECGGDITAVWDYLDLCGRTITHTQVVTVSPAPIAAWTNAPGPLTITCDEALTFIPIDLNYSNSVAGACDISGTVMPSSIDPQFTECGGTITIDWEFTDNCNNQITHQQIVTVQPSAPAVYLSFPADITIACDVADAFAAPNLDYTNSESGTCEITGSSIPVIVEAFNECGGTITVTWTFTDICARNITHVQNVTVDPAPIADWITPPGPITITCDEVDSYVYPQLGYSNVGPGDCLVEGFVDPVVDSNYTECGGTITVTWDFVDSCNNAIQHIQIITVDPAPPADWVNAPGPITISCNEADTLNPQPLGYTNNGLGGCLIEGQAPPQVTETFDECGGTISILWQYTDDCSRLIEWTQDIIVEPAPIAQWVNPPPDTSISCDAAIVYVAPQLNLTNAGIGVCIIQGIADPLVTNNFTECGGTITVDWAYTDDCARLIEHQQIITVDPTSEATWQNAPGPISITCNEALTYVHPVLNYSNSASGLCLISGTANPVAVDDYNECGGTITVTWNTIDPCGRPLDYEQIITVTEAPIAQWTNAPGPITITCDEALTFVPDVLDYSNADQGVCLIAGNVNASNVDADFTECGGTITIDWSFIDNCNREITHQQIVTVEESAIAAWINTPVDVTLTCSEADAFVAGQLEYSNGENAACEITGFVDPQETRSYNECGGQFTIYWTFTDACSRQIEHTQIITVTPAAPAQWINPPVDITITCAEATAFVPDPLQYSNAETGACIIEGEAQPVVNPAFTECGGTITVNWEFTDSCNNQITHQQIITVSSSVEAAWINELGDITISCEEADTLSPRALGYSNNDPGTCLIEGSVFPVEVSSFDECGGSIVYTWIFTDNCNRTITHTQNITVDPAPEAAWVDAPADITITCAEALAFVAPSLDYTNGDPGVCLIAGSANPQEVRNFTQCGGTIEVSWIFTDNCNRTISHTQLITVEPALEPQWVNQPADITIRCDVAVNYSAEVLTITNNDPGSCEITTTVNPVMIPNFNECGGSISVTWDYQDPCGRTFNHTQEITVTPAPVAQWVSPPDDITITCAEADSYLIPDLEYSNGDIDVCLISGTVSGVRADDYNECGGEILISWEFTDNCNRTLTHTQIVSVSPSPVATFLSVPDDITLSCTEAVDFVPQELQYSNSGAGSCLIEGSVQGDADNRYDVCGGEIEVLWRFKDNCDRIIEHVQIVTVEPTAPAAYVDPPANFTLTCAEADAYVPENLFFTNNDNNCLIEGNTPANSIVNEYDQCGGAIYIGWYNQDNCGRSISHNIEITILPAPSPIWINPPEDITLSCELFEDYPINNLSFTNGESGSCIIEGDVPGSLNTIDDDECDPHYQARWIYTDPCNNTIEHIQNIYLIDTTPPTITGTPADITVDCNNIPDPPFIYNVIDAFDNCRKPLFTFNEEQLPGPCENIYLLVRTWTADDECGNTLQTMQVITVRCPPELTIDIQPSDIVCEGVDVMFNSNISKEYISTVYQWQYSSNSTDWNDIAGETASTLNIDSAHALNEGYYRLVAADNLENLLAEDCNVISNPIRLQVIPTLFNIMNRSICTGEQVLIGNTSYTESGNFVETLTASSGCDSIIFLNLTVNEHTSASIQQDICQGENVVVGSEIFDATGVYTVVLNNRLGCDSTVTLDLTVHEPFSETRIETICLGESIEINNELFTATGNYLVAMQDQFGCDSLISLQLTVIDPVYRDLDITICEGETYTVGSEVFDATGVYTINLQAASGCDSIVNLDLTETSVIETELNRVICTGDSLLFDGIYQKISGTYSGTYVSAAGCDSTATLNLSIVDEITYELEVNICEGESYTVNGVDYSESGIQFISLPSSAGCDSLIIFTLHVHEKYEATLNESICSGEFVEINGTPYNTTGSYDINMISSAGCDSIIHLNLVVNEQYYININETFCEGGSIQIGNNIYSETGIYIDSFLTVTGCDSVVITNLIINPEYDTTLQEIICSGSSVSVGNETYSATGIYSQTLSTVDGCDSIVNLDLTVVDELTSETSVQICNGQSYTFGTQIITEAGSYNETFPSSQGCDSVVTLNLTTVDILTSFVDELICDGETIEFFGTEYSLPGSYPHSMQSSQGCDSIVTLNLQLAPNKEREIDIILCEGESYEFNNQTYVETGSYEALYQTSLGCDSLVTLNLTVNKVYLDSIKATICEGNNFEFNNQNYSTSGFYTANLSTAQGCDSTTVLELSVLETVFEEVNAQICEGSFYRFGGEQKTASGQYTSTLISSKGCDSIVTLNLEVVSELTETVTAQICEGSSYEFNGETYSSSGSFSATLTSSLGCDSIATLELSIVNEVTTDLDIEICDGETYLFDNESFQESGQYVKSFISALGCDSIVTLNLLVHPTYKDTLDVTICEGETFMFDGESHQQTGTYMANHVSQYSCDSMVVLLLEVIPTVFDSIEAQICFGENYTLGAQTLNQTGQYIETFSSIAGCDSMVVLQLEVLNQIIEDKYVQLCNGSSVEFNGITYDQPTTQTATFNSSQGCDSTVTLNVSVVDKVQTAQQINLCDGETFTFKDSIITHDGIFSDTLISQNGCDSISTVELLFHPLFTDSSTVEICAGDVYNYQDQDISETGFYNFVLQTIAGCDSTVTIFVNVLPGKRDTVTVQICNGSTYLFNGADYSESGTYDFSIASSLGCDSIVTLDLEVLDPLVETKDVQICEGGSYEFNDSTYTESVQLSATLISSLGCDSVVNLNLAVLTELTTSINTSICEGETYSFDNNTLSDSGTYLATYGSSLGCDSVVTLTLSVLDNVIETVDAFICEGSAYSFGDQSLEESGTYEMTFNSATGCDSIVTLNLTVDGQQSQEMNVTICTGDTYAFNGEEINQSGNYSASYQSISGCDSVINLNLSIVDEILMQESYSICPGETVMINDIEYSDAVEFSTSFTSLAGCDSTVNYSISLLPSIALSAEDYKICAGESVQIQVQGAENRAITWSPSEGLTCLDCQAPIAKPLQTTTYNASVEGCNGEIVNTSVTVEVLQYPIVQAPEDRTISRGESVSLTVITEETVLTDIWWYKHQYELICTACKTITDNPTSTTEYIVSAINEFGCVVEDNVVVFVEDICELDKVVVANAMTPNDDGFNDFFEIRNNGLSEIILVQVFNRWGEIVFESESIDDKWDGTYRGVKVSPGVFAYLVKVKCIGGKETELIYGNVTVIR